MKPEARVFEITSLTKKISLNYHLNKFFELKYCFFWAECLGICHLHAACQLPIILNFHLINLHSTLFPTSCIVSSEEALCARRWQDTDFDNRKSVKDEERCVVNAIPKFDAIQKPKGGWYLWKLFHKHVSAILSQASKPQSKRRL